jgi:hypothetical protein
MFSLPEINGWLAFWAGCAAGFTAGMLVFSLLAMNRDHGPNQDS